MNKPIANSELILNSDGSIYHLHLLPEDLADTVITVGDPDRVAAVSRHFDTYGNRASFADHPQRNPRAGGQDVR